MTIYDHEQALRNRLDSVLRTIRNQGANGFILAEYSRVFRELSDIQEQITTLEDAEGLEAPVATVGPNIPEGR